MANMLNCAKCMQPLGCVEPLTALNKRWHPNCFQCNSCHCNLVDKDFSSKNNAPYCEACFTEKHRPMCDKCGQQIDSGEKYAVIGSVSFHTKCFVCEECQKPLFGQKYATKKGRITCLAHR